MEEREKVFLHLKSEMPHYLKTEKSICFSLSLAMKTCIFR